MFTRRRLAGIVAFLLCVSAVRGQDTPRVIIERAIKAHGGMEKLSRIRADQVQIKGNVFVEGKETPFVGSTMVQPPSQFKNVAQVTTPKGRVTLVEILNGENVLVMLDGQPQKVTTAAQNQIRATFQLNRAVRLVSLLMDRTYELAGLAEVKINERPAVGVRVTGKGRPELRLFFDKETGLLVKAENNLDAGDGKEVRQEVYYGEFRDFDGHKRPSKLIAFRDGKKVMEAELTDVKYLDKIDDVEFTRP